jgi:hypothetical protein
MYDRLAKSLLARIDLSVTIVQFLGRCSGGNGGDAAGATGLDFKCRRMISPSRYSAQSPW